MFIIIFILYFLQALTLVDQLRPNEPIPFIANFMLKNKSTMKNLDEFVKNLSDDNKNRNMMGGEEEEIEEMENEEGMEDTMQQNPMEG